MAGLGQKYKSWNEKTFANAMFPDSTACCSRRTKIGQVRLVGPKPGNPMRAVLTAGAVVAALALAAGTATESAAMTAANAASGFRRDIIDRASLGAGRPGLPLVDC
jgi:hypothetical protein